MRIKKVCQILKGIADDTRLRTINLLQKHDLNVGELRRILGVSQSNLSKHLAKLRLTGIVSDRRRGPNVYYYLRKADNRAQEELIKAIASGFSEIEVFKKDLAALKKVLKKGGKV